MRRGQTTAEYIFLIGAAAAGLIVMLVYVSRGHQGRLRSEAEQLGARQYDPGNTVIDNSEIKTLSSVATAGSSTTTEHGNLNEENTALLTALDNLNEQYYYIYLTRDEWEFSVVDEAKDWAEYVKSGNFDWDYSMSYLSEVESALTTLDEELDLIDQAIQNAISDFDLIPRTEDKTTSGSYSSESGTVTVDKYIDETLGDL